MKYVRCFILIMCIFMFAMIFRSTYAKYKEKVNGTTTINVASWNIIVNNEEILDKKELSADITPVFSGNEYVKEGVIAPGVSGYYDIIINSKDVDVAFSYEITPTNSENSAISDLVITGYSIDDGETNDFSEKITGNILVNKGSTTIRIYIKWDDEGNMSNEDDTKAALNNDKAYISNDIIFSQIK